MTSKRVVLTCGLIALSCTASAEDNTPPPGKVFVYKGVGETARQMEVYFPPRHDPAAGKVPGLILFHGGGWRGGSLRQFRAACDYFARRGLVCATAEYRMLTDREAAALPAGESRKRVCITDAKSAIRWFKRQSGEFGLDPDRIIVGGGSAGGHLAVLATLNPGLNDPADPQEINTTAAAYLLFNPAFTADDERDAEVDALRYLKRDLPPALVFFGDRDDWKKGWDAAQSKLKTLGAETVEVQTASNQGHGFFNKEPWQTATLAAADRFLVRQKLLADEPLTLKPKSEAKLSPEQP